MGLFFWPQALQRFHAGDFDAPGAAAVGGNGEPDFVDAGGAAKAVDGARQAVGLGSALSQRPDSVGQIAHQ